MSTPYTWDNANFAWNNNPYTWDDVALAQELAGAIGGGRNYQEVHKVLKDPKKKKQFVKLLCKVQGKEYEETKETTDYKIVISDVQLVVSELASTVKLQL